MEVLMFDEKKQRQVLLARLDYYRKVFPIRSPEYRAFKERISIPRIKIALERLDQGTYGVCVDCSASIDILRLHAVPAALHCVVCQAQHEKNLKAQLA
jgi:hypothetical protein